ncbi:MAG: hypothetical protein JXN60_07540 [Lentisphaerae bacterium]|nr:hypothetical protein [Lentisphaerota bacterium]
MVWDRKAGVISEYFEYHEPGVMKEYGLQAGPSVSVSCKSGAWRWNILGDWRFGNLQYVGGVGAFSGLFRVKTPNDVYQLRVGGGRTIALGSLALVPCLGVGVRHLVNELPDYGVLQGYTRAQTYIYVPVTVCLETKLFDKNVVCRFEYDYFVRGYNHAMDEKLEQDAGFGLKASASLTWASLSWLAGAALEIGPYISYWDIEISNLSGGLYEPSNYTTQFGLRCVAMF